MPEFGDVARIRDTNNFSEALLKSQVPDIDTSEGRHEAAQFMWRRLTSDLVTAKSPTETRDGQQGIIWQGNIRKDVIYYLWPSLQDSMHVDRGRSEEIISSLLDYLVSSSILSCRKKSSKFTPGVWWVNTHWTPMEIRKTVVPPTAEEAVVSQAAQFPCRGCSVESFVSTAGRSTHEMQVHKAAFSEDGTAYKFDDSFNDEYIKGVVKAVLENSAVLPTLRGVKLGALALDPRMREVAVLDGLDLLVEEGSVLPLQVGARIKYKLADLAGTVQESLPEAEDSEDPVAPRVKEDPVAITAVGPVVDGISTSVEHLRQALSTARGILLTTHNRVTEALETVDSIVVRAKWLEERLRMVEQELAGYKMKAMAQNNSLSNNERENNTALIKELTDALETVTDERDRYKAQWDNFQRAIKGVLPALPEDSN
jgi:hypothetical protein